MATKRSATKNKAPELSRRQSTLHAHFTRRRRSPSPEKVQDLPAPVTQDPDLASQPLVAQDSDCNEDASVLLEVRSGIPLDAESSDGDFAEPIDLSAVASDTDILAQYPASPLASLPASPQTSTSSSPEILSVNLPEPPPPPRVHPFFTRKAVNVSGIPPELIHVVDDDDDVVSETSASLREPSIEITCPSPPPNPPSQGLRYESPILVDSSPAKPSGPPNGLQPKPPIRVTPSVKGTSLPPRKVHPMFAPRPAKLREPSPLVPNRSIQRPAPFPDAESQHVRGNLSNFSPQPHGFPKKDATKARSQPQSPSSSSALSILIKAGSHIELPSETLLIQPDFIPEEREAYLASIPRAHVQTHPAIGRIVASMNQDTASLRPVPPPSSQMLWSDRWRPSHADEVLGNEQSALYLRDWLSALQLHITSILPSAATGDSKQANGLKSTSKSKKPAERRGTKRPRVIRAVDKKKSRKKRRIDEDDDNDWIVADDIPEADLFPEDNEEDLQPTRRIYRQESVPIEHTPPSSLPVYKFDSLSNTILLTGPPGVGKTAAVYACAEELGWDVFEVYPGIGKRGGTNLDNLVGEVGKSHLVGTSVRRHADMNVGPEKKSPSLFLRKKNRKMKTIDSEEEDNSTPFNNGTASNDLGFLTDSPTGETLGSGEVRQSIVLLEEVDILFKDDTNFWPVVTNFIKDCRRPVICTCNDPSLVPVDDLPLQATLQFVHPDPDITVSYLQALCCAEGTLVDRASLARLYESEHPIDDVDIHDSKVTGTTSIFPHFDVRRTINSLQLWLSGSGNPARSAQGIYCDQSLEDLMFSGNVAGASEDADSQSLRAPFHAEFLSYLDSHLVRHPTDSVEALWHNTTELSHDDEIGHTVLVCPSRPLSVHDGLGMYDRDTLIAEGAIRCARGMLKTIVDQGMFRPRELFRARVGYHSQVVAVLEGVLPEAILQRPCILHLEYGPRVRVMVAADDAEEAFVLSQSRGGRTTRNSLGYVRHIGLGASEREQLSRSGLE
ncbi:AAA+ ATPase domain-containing protein [Pleurotus pulmonarius]